MWNTVTKLFSICLNVVKILFVDSYYVTVLQQNCFYTSRVERVEPATGMLQKASPKKVDKVDRVSRFRDNISEDIPQAGSEEQEEETFVPEEFWKDVHKQFKNSQMLAAVKLKDKMSRFFEETKIS